MPLVPCGCGGSGSCNYINCDGWKFEMPRGVPTEGGGVARVLPTDVLWAIPHSRRLLAVERGGAIVGYATVRTVLYTPDDPLAEVLNPPTDTLEGAARLGLGSWPSLDERAPR